MLSIAFLGERGRGMCLSACVFCSILQLTQQRWLKNMRREGKQQVIHLLFHKQGILLQNVWVPQRNFAFTCKTFVLGERKPFMSESKSTACTRCPTQVQFIYILWWHDMCPPWQRSALVLSFSLEFMPCKELKS